jgi:hypothetical protein
MAINFPTGSAINTVFSSSGKYWQWDGVTWNSYGAGTAISSSYATTASYILSTTAASSSYSLSSSYALSSSYGVTASYAIAGGTVGTSIIVADTGTNSTVRCGSNNCAQAIYSTISGGTGSCIVPGSNYSTIAGGYYNNITGTSKCSGILGGQCNVIGGYNDSFIIGSNLTANTACTTFVNNLCVAGSLFATSSYSNNATSASYSTTSSYLSGISSPTTNGYTYLPGGLIMQWGKTGSFASESGITASFPLPFPTALLNAQATILGSSGGGWNDVGVAIFSPTTTSMVTYVNTFSPSVAFPYCVYWTAIGY